MDTFDAGLRRSSGTARWKTGASPGDDLVGPDRDVGVPRHRVAPARGAQGRPLRLDGPAAGAGAPGYRPLPAVVGLALRRSMEPDARAPG